jgi:PhzF family phenazine biosynthesis protein
VRRGPADGRLGLVQRQFRQVDVFSPIPYLGNPVAVVLDADGLSDSQLQQFASWTNLSETTFVLPADDGRADYRVRIFTASAELPFAGHPTLGTCHAWLAAGGMPRQQGAIVQQCAAGLIRIRQDGERLAFAAPPLLRSGPAGQELTEHLAEVLRISPDQIVEAQWADNGPGWVAVLLRTADEVLALRPGAVDLDIGVAGPYPPGAPEALEVRAFVPANGAAGEDPVTGSLNAALAQWLLSRGLVAAPYIASQGTALGRRGRVHISRDEDGTIWVGGATVTCLSGVAEI